MRGKDETGNRYGYWTVLEKANRRSKSRGLYWKCECVCGILRDVEAKGLRSNRSTNCGCRRKEPLKNYFKDRYKIDYNTDCWNWTGCLGGCGYGKIHMYGYLESAHRYSYKLHKGKIGKGLFVCHHCDNRKCVNPDHLWLGTQKDNMQDMVKKGRQNKGEKNFSHKLKESQVIEIIQTGKNGLSYEEIGKKYEVSGNCIRDILTKKAWKHVHTKILNLRS